MGAPEKPTYKGTLGERIRAWRRQQRLSLTELALAAAVGTSYLSKIERHQIEHPGREHLAAIAKALGISLQDLDGYPPSWSRMKTRTQHLRIRGRIAAGKPLVFPRSKVEALDLNEHLAENAYALEVIGRSLMDANIIDGDYIIVEEDPDPEQGSLVVAIHSANINTPGKATIRRYYKYGDRMELHPENKDKIDEYKLEIPAREWHRHWRIQGKVRGIYRPYRSINEPAS